MSLSINTYNERSKAIFHEITGNIQSKYGLLQEKIHALMDDHIISNLFNPEMICRIELHERDNKRNQCMEVKYCIVIRLISNNQFTVCVWPELREYRNNLYKQWRQEEFREQNRICEFNVTACLNTIHTWIREELCQGSCFTSSVRSYDQALFLSDRIFRKITTSNCMMIYQDFREHDELISSFFVRKVIERQAGRPVLSYLYYKGPLPEEFSLKNPEGESSATDLSSIFHTLFL